MESTKPAVEEGLRGLTIIFYALLAGQLLFAAVVYYLISSGQTSATPFVGPTEDFIGVTAYVLAMIAMSIFLVKLRTKNETLPKGDPKFGIGHYRATVILRLAVLEGAALFVVVIALVTGNVRLFVAFAIALAAFYRARPTLREFAETYS